MNGKVIVYRATFENGKCYIGITNNLSKRKDSHRRKAESGSRLYFHCAIRKYGFKTIKWIVLSAHDTRAEAELMEIKMISENQPNYNIAPGGSSPAHTDQSKEKIRKAKSGKKCSIEAKLNMKKAQMSFNNTKEGKITHYDNFLKHFHAGTLTEPTIQRLLKLKEVYAEGVTLDMLSNLSGISNTTILRYQEYWMKLDEYVSRIRINKSGYNLKKYYDKDIRWQQKRIRKDKKNNEIYQLSKINTKDKSLPEISKITDISIPRLGYLKRCWEDMLEEEGF